MSTPQANPNQRSNEEPDASFVDRSDGGDQTEDREPRSGNVAGGGGSGTRDAGPMRPSKDAEVMAEQDKPEPSEPAADGGNPQPQTPPTPGKDAAPPEPEPGPAGVCTSSELRCQGDSVQQCGEDGQWLATGTTCPFVCKDGVCTGDCVPQTKQCAMDGARVELCDENGAWTPGEICPSVCSKGECAGTCVPDSKECTGKSARTCGDDGSWLPPETCPFVCKDGACAGTCTPNAVSCSNLTPQTCDANGNWNPGTPCPAHCDEGKCKPCRPGTSGCVPNSTTPRLCTSEGEWQNTAITANTCGAECTPGSSGCFPNSNRAASCNAQGKWVAGAISTACGADCMPSSPATCDPTTNKLMRCTSSGTWDGAIVPGMCNAVCMPDAFACGVVGSDQPFGWSAGIGENSAYHVTCNARGLWGPQVFCSTPCHLSCPGKMYDGPAMFCVASGAAPTCYTGGGECPANMPIDGC